MRLLKNVSKFKSRSGFTLIEMSIVLVIIGLIVGGILVGRDLIYSAQIRAQIKQMEQLETAYNTFNVKYGCLPGDCANATTFFGTVDSNGNTIANGDGDGIIRSIYGYGSTYTTGECLMGDINSEVAQLFLHLNLAGIGNYSTKGTVNIGTSGSGAIAGKDYPTVSFGNGTGIYITCLSSPSNPTTLPAFLNTGNIIVVGGASISGFRIIYNMGLLGTAYGYNGGGVNLGPTGIPADVARQIDTKIDDGLPSSGKFGIIAGSAAACTTNVTAYPSSSTFCNATVGKKIN